jgi:hypothetical protein
VDAFHTSCSTPWAALRPALRKVVPLTPNAPAMVAKLAQNLEAPFRLLMAS